MSTEHTAGPWEVFICDDGGEWTGWPLSISAKNDPDKTIVRPGGQWPYAWDAATSQREAVANARLIAAAPDMLEALRLHKAWSDSERAGPDYGGQTRDTHPDGGHIWRLWWNGQLDLCDRANRATDAALAKVEGRSS